MSIETRVEPEFLHALFLPAYPAAWLLFGLIFAQAIAHIFAVPWPRTATILVYMVPLVWVSAIAWRQRRCFGKVSHIDILFSAFTLVVLASTLAAMQDGGGEAARKYLRFLPFMMVVPYLCGRLMRLADVDLLLRVTLIAALIVMPLLLLDRFMSPGREAVRWPIFGMDHGALLVGVLLAAALIALCARVLAGRNPGARQKVYLEGLIDFGLIPLVTVVLVWVMARGWLIAGLLGTGIVCLAMHHRAPAIRAGLFGFVVGVAALSLMILPVSGFYKMLFTAPVTAPVTAPGLGPILGEASCHPFKEGVNSVAIRWVLYQEAAAMFAEHPILGVGATRFGERSCTGPGWYPHSTILQGFAELGLVGGGLLVGLLVLAAFTLARPFRLAAQGRHQPAQASVLALFAMFLVADQFYGNYFMSIGTWLMVGIAASMRSQSGKE